MRPAVGNMVMDAANRLSSLSIIVDDFDSSRNKQKKPKQAFDHEEVIKLNLGVKPYTRKSSDAAIKKIMEEAELRKHEFCKLIDEHDALIEYLKQIEKEHSKLFVCKMNQSSIMT